MPKPDPREFREVDLCAAAFADGELATVPMIAELELLAVSLSNSDRTPLRRAIEAYRAMDLTKPPRERPPAQTARQVPRVTAIQMDRLVERYVTGAKVGELASEFGIDRRTVSHHLRHNGVALRPHPLPAETIDQMVSLYEAGLSLAAVGTKTGTTPFAVQRELRKRGVAVRPKTRRKRTNA